MLDGFKLGQNCSAIEKCSTSADSSRMMCKIRRVILPIASSAQLTGASVMTKVTSETHQKRLLMCLPNGFAAWSLLPTDLTSCIKAKASLCLFAEI